MCSLLKLFFVILVLPVFVILFLTLPVLKSPAVLQSLLRMKIISALFLILCKNKLRAKIQAPNIALKIITSPKYLTRNNLAH